MKVSFRSSRAQATHIVQQLAAHGVDRHTHKSEGLIHSIGSERNIREGISRFADWLKAERRADIRTVTRGDCIDYLHQRMEIVGQSTLNSDRQSLNRLLTVVSPNSDRLPLVKSELEAIVSSRAYTAAQVEAIMLRQSARNAITTELAYRCGIRAHEAFTLRREYEQVRSVHRQWRDDLNCGRENHIVYTVNGKGGLVRQVFVPPDLAHRLEARRRPEAVRVSDRGIFYAARYDIGGGQQWSQSFSASSQRALGWTQGGHGCRHAFIQGAMENLKRDGYSDDDARLVCSQLAGHFRPDVISAYLR